MAKKTRLSEVPEEHLDKVFHNLVKFRGIQEAAIAVAMNIKLSEAFPWLLTDEGHLFWMEINGDISAEDAALAREHGVEDNQNVSRVKDGLNELEQLLVHLKISMN
jgi:hypothetical protein